MIKLVIFDMDGVLTSTTDEHFAAWSALFLRTYNIELDPALEVKTKGVSRMASLEVLLNHYHLSISDSQKEILADDKNKHYQVLISRFDEGKLIEGVIRLLDFLKSKGILLALGSASKNGPFLLKSLGIEKYFDYVVDPTELNSKPDPAIFLDARNYFSLKSSECLGVEDAVAGVEAIKAAGMIAIGVGNEDLHKADLIVNRVVDLDYIQLEKLLNTSL
jgi:beta-phosphoglucomutase